MLDRLGRQDHNFPMPKSKRPKDANQLAKLIVGLATGEVIERALDEGKNPAAVALGRLGGLKGGKARAIKLSSKAKREIALKAAQKRWHKD